MSWVTFPTFSIVHRLVIDALAPSAVEASLFLGKVYDTKGLVVPDWFTVRSKYIALVRDTEIVTYRYCEECGSLLYSAVGRKWGLCPAPSESLVYQTSACELICHERLVSPALFSYRRKLSIWRIGVVSRPLDGLPEQLELRRVGRCEGVE